MNSLRLCGGSAATTATLVMNATFSWHSLRAAAEDADGGSPAGMLPLWPVGFRGAYGTEQEQKAWRWADPSSESAHSRDRHPPVGQGWTPGQGSGQLNAATRLRRNGSSGRDLVLALQTDEAYVRALGHRSDPRRGELGRDRIGEDVLPDRRACSEFTEPFHHRSLQLAYLALERCQPRSPLPAGWGSGFYVLDDHRDRPGG